MSDRRQCLHLVCRAELANGSADGPGWADFAATGDGVLLMMQGTGLLAQDDWWTRPSDGVRCYALKADLQARGLDSLAESRPVSVVDDDGFVRLITEYAVNQTWA